MSEFAFKILIADDSADFRRFLEVDLTKRFNKLEPRLRIEFIHASTLAEGIAKSPLSNSTILDGSFADSPNPMDTIQHIHRLMKPVIFLTGSDDPNLLTSARVLGAAGVFVKGSTDDLPGKILECFIVDAASRGVRFHA